MKKLDPNAVWLFFFAFLFQFNFILLFLFWILGSVGLGFILGTGGFIDVPRVITYFATAVVFTSILAFIWAKLSYYFYRYEITELGFKKESGVIWKKYVTIPFNRIQNVDIHRGIIARLLGISDLLIQTAGNSAAFSRRGVSGIGAEGRLPGIAKVEAEILRDELVKLASRRQDQGL